MDKILSTRNALDITGVLVESDDIDTVYETCDQEFNSRKDIHLSFAAAAGIKSWARFFLLHEVQKICTRDNILLHQAARLVVANRIAEDWFKESRMILH